MFSLFFPLVSTGAAIAIFFFYLQPAYGRIGSVREEVGYLQTTLESAREIQSERDRLVSKYDAIPTADLARLEKMLPDHVDNVRLILEIDDIAKNYGMNLSDIALDTERQRTSSNAAAAAGKSAGTPGTVMLSFSVGASYETFLQFLQDLERSLRVMDITSLTLKPGVPERGRPVDNYYTYGVSLQTYWLE